MKRAVIAATLLVLPLAALVAPAEASHDSYTVEDTFEYGPGSWGSRTVYCNFPDFALSYDLDKTGRAKLSSAMFFGHRTGNETARSEDEGVVVEWRNRSKTRGGTFTVTLVCDPD